MLHDISVIRQNLESLKTHADDLIEKSKYFKLDDSSVLDNEVFNEMVLNIQLSITTMKALKLTMDVYRGNTTKQ